MILNLFEDMSGLKVNYYKSMLVGINVDESSLNEVASILSCKIGRLPFLYLGLPIGGDDRRLIFWEPVIDRIKSRQFDWNSRNLYFGGHCLSMPFLFSELPSVYSLPLNLF